jgi:hypothetical protein
MITICGKEYSTDITELDLRSFRLTTIPEEIKYFTNLEVLNLAFNKITAISEHIFDHLTNLKSLYLYNNKITTIPEHIFDHLINLKLLTLSSNQITEIPEHIFDRLINLRKLNLSYNQITAIPEHLFDHLINLKLLNLSWNNITATPEHIFDRLINLRKLNLSCNRITAIPKHLFDHLTNLNTLFLFNNKITAIPEHLFDSLTNLECLDLSYNEITATPISILNCRLLINFSCYDNPFERIDVRIQRFMDDLKTRHLLNDSPKVHSSIKDSINSLMRYPFTMNKEDIINQLVEESPVCLQSLLCYLDDEDIHPTLYLTFLEVFVKVWGRIIGSDFKADLIKRLDEEMIDSECKCLTDRISQLLNVLVGFFSDISITDNDSKIIYTSISSVLNGREMLDERIGDIISSVLNGREMSDELKELCRKSLKEAEIEDDEIGKWLDMKIIL